VTTSAHPPDDAPTQPRSAATWYDVLDVTRDADVKAIQVAYERAIALIEGKHLGAYFVLDPAATTTARRDIEAAFATLSDDDRRRAYDRSLVGDDTDPLLVAPPPPATRPPAPTSVTPRAALRFLAPVESPAATAQPTTALPPTTVVPTTVVPMTLPPTTVAPTPAPTTLPPTTLPPMTLPPMTLPPMTLPPTTVAPTPAPTTVPPSAHRRIDLPTAPTPTPPPGLLSLDGEVNGQTLRRLREYRRLGLDELAEATKIRRAYLAAIEEQDFENLPSRVYLRGFLTQIARVLRVDKTRLADGYLAFIARYGG
jgi:hypothetical protein